MRLLGETWLLLLTIVAWPAIASPIPSQCVWNQSQSGSKCSDDVYTWDGAYPKCALFQFADRSPIPCQGQVGADYCRYEGKLSNSPPPRPASWHVHVFFPNVRCTNCSSAFTTEHLHFSFDGAMQLRREIAAQLNKFTQQITGQAPSDPIELSRAYTDPSYNQCGDVYNIVAGAPANFHDKPCIFEVDSVKKGGPFTDPETGEGYPNYSFLLPSEFWLPGLLQMVREWLQTIRGRYGQYDVLIHPNTGCEVRDHAEERSIEWLGTPYPLLTEVFSCRALGCNQACPKVHGASLPAPANCSTHDSLGALDGALTWL